ncbi:hypothetical protein Thini_2051 [Thiothrix nivea DSM 5205]|uniref:Uncharacterized protein n=1 Tax=Thiothrix nivea (strain ATCC 35100 / DSM 5205 / JP2) TaxID=870187 RepID=A0A656HE36_THINJ|nr:hypothetical protein Thini_2051 [Thiothrix nivea DSM 5205]
MMVRKITIATAIGLLFIGSGVLAESQYGYKDDATGNVTATAQAKVQVTVPKLILLRVGTAGTTVDQLTFDASPTVNSAPGSTLADGSNQEATWDGVAPLFADTGGQDLNAFVWTNALNGANLTCATTADAMFTAGEGLTSSNVEVARSAGTLNHPGATTACGTTVPVTRNTLMTATWTYSIKGTTLAQAAAGVHTQTTTYTATTL